MESKTEVKNCECEASEMVGGGIVFCPIHAAAPELLEAAKIGLEILKVCRDKIGNRKEFNDDIATIESAIAKASA